MCEPLEERALLSVGTALDAQALPGDSVEHQYVTFDEATRAPYAPSQGSGVVPGDVAPLGSSGVVGLTPQQIRTAYGITGDGAGTTIAIVDPYDNPAFVTSTNANFAGSDLHKFDQQFGLPDPVFTKVDFSGGTVNSGWIREIALDVEWAHAIAPGAAVLLVEAKAGTYPDLMNAIDYARNQSGVVAVSLSWGSPEFSVEKQFDGFLTTPAGHTGVTFLAGSGDNGSPGLYPAYSPNVVAVGGTHLTLSGGNYGSETAWSLDVNGYGSGGGQSTIETEPSYQNGVQTSGRRQIPDVAFDADPATGVAVYDSYTGGTSPWYQTGGTSVATPCWAGLVAIADGLRISQGLTPLDGRSQTLPALYALSAADFHDITSGSNGGFSAAPGYDLVTGRGSPVANLLVPDLAASTLPPATTFYSNSLDTNPGWTTSGQWAFGQPTGQGAAWSGNPDPTSGYTGSNVYGVNLNGDYSTTVGGPYYLTTTPIDCTGYTGVTLQFERWLNSEGWPTVPDTVDVSNDGVNWTNVYRDPAGTTVTDSSWQAVQYDISAVADNHASVRVRWGYQVWNNAYPYSGWNIDDVTLRGFGPPVASSLTPNTTLVTDNNVGNATFSLSVVFDRAMDRSVIPSIAFPTQDPSSTLSLNGAQSGWTNLATYVARYDVTEANTALANVDVRVSGAKDLAGNLQSPKVFPAAFSIDTLDPVAPTIVGLANDTGASHSDKITIDPTLNLSGQEQGATVQYSFSYDGGSTWSSWGPDTPVDSGNGTPVSVEVRQIDAEGNVGPASAAFGYTYDATAPVVVSAVPTETMIEASNAATTLAVNVTYDESMWFGYVPVVGFSPDVIASGVLHFDSGQSGWVTDTIYKAAYDVSATPGVYVPAVGINLAGGRDVAGNLQMSYQGTNAFDIDTLTVPAHVTSAAPSVRQLTQTNLGPNNTVGVPDPSVAGQGFVVRVTYDTDMAYNVGYTPVVTVASPDASSTLTFDPTYSWWVNPTMYRAGFDVSPSNLNVQGFHIAVAGGHDLANSYLQARYVGPEAFDVNMTHALSPAFVVNAYPYLTLISNRNVGSDTFGMTVSFNRDMSMGANLAFSFSQGGTAVDVSNVLQLDSINSYWVNSTDYKVQYNVLPGTSVNLANLSINVAGGQDPVGNPPVPYTSPALFSIDTLDAPPPMAQVKSITVNLETVTAANTMATAGSDSFSVTVQYDQQMMWYASIPTLTFVPDPNWYPVAGTLQLDLANSFWTGPDTYQAEFNVQNYYTIVNPSVGIAVTGGKDAYGNLQTPYSGAGTDYFEVNTAATAPLAVVVSVVSNLTLVTQANLGPNNTVGVPDGTPGQGLVEIITFDQSMRGNNPTVFFTPTNPDPSGSQSLAIANTLTYDPAWSFFEDADNTIFRAAFDVAGSGVNVRDITANVKGARDLANNYDQMRYSGPAGFHIDTYYPAPAPTVVSSPTPSVATVTTALVGQHTFYIDIVYSGSMRMNSTPTVSLAPTDGDPTEAQDIASTLTLNSDYSGWVGDGLTYKAVYDVAASNVIVQEVNVLVSGGLDAVGNPPASYSGTNVFNINTAPAPGAVPASPSAASLADAVLSSGALHLTVGTSTVPADQQPAINPVDAALLYTGTWLNA